MRISMSDVSTFLRCRKLWEYTGKQRLDLTPRMVAQALTLGTGVHEALERFYRAEALSLPIAVGDKTPLLVAYFNEWAAKQVQEWNAQDLRYDVEKFTKLFELGNVMLAGYSERYGAKPEYDIDGITVLATEQEFAVPIPGTTDGWLVGRMDGILRDAKGNIWVLENKTYSTRPRNLNLHQQMMGYTWALTMLVRGGAMIGLGIQPDARVRGALYNGLRKQVPGPRVKDDLFVREWVRHTQNELAIFVDTLTAMYAQMSDPEVAIYPTVTRDCDWCAFLEPCTSYLTGDDDTWLLQTSYVKRESRGMVYEEPDE